MPNKEIEAFVEKTGEKLIAIASNETKDRMGDIVKVDGWILSNFKKNPVLLFAHQYNQPPIGLAKNIKVQDGKLIFEPVFHEITQLARDIKAMFMAEPPIMRAFSVGFLPTKFNEKDQHIIEEQELLEISAVPVPANQDALLSVSKSISPEDEKSIDEWIKEKEVEKEEEIPSVDEEGKPEEEKVEEKVEEKKQEKSPACRMEGESKNDCVSRKIPEIMREDPEMKQDQAIAIAESLCSEMCSEKSGKKEVKIEEKEGKNSVVTWEGKQKPRKRERLLILKESLTTV